MTYEWTELDLALDRIIDLGVEPLVCLSYTPEIISSMPPDTPRGPVNGDPGLYPPTDYDVWEEVVYQTVRHVNIDRGLGIRYWEVWNEPNNVFLRTWHLWTWTRFLPFSGFIEDLKKQICYLWIYESAVKGAVRADTTIRVGGPTVLCNGDVEDFTGSVKRWVKTLAWWCDWRGLPLDFVPVHMYAGPPDSQSPEDFGDFVRMVGQWASREDGSAPEVMVDEWNALSMEGGHDTATDYHAVWTLKSLKAMMDAGARHSVYFANAFFLSLFDTDGKTPFPTYNVLRMYARLQGQRLDEVSDPRVVQVIAARSDSTLTVLLWRLGTMDRIAQVSVSHLVPSEKVSYRVYNMDREHSNLQAGGRDAELSVVESGIAATDGDGNLTLGIGLPRTSVALWEIDLGDQ